MADDDDETYGERSHVIGTEAWRKRFFHDIRLTVRDETSAGVDRLERSIGAAVDKLRQSRVDDTKDAIHQSLSISPEEVPELVAVVHTAISARRVRVALWGQLWDTIKGSTLEVARHALTAAILAVVGYLIATRFGALPAWLK